MMIADDLECTGAERNRLLMAAGLDPEQPDLRGEDLTAVLRVAQRLLFQLPFPRVTVTRDWTIHGWNAPMQTLMQLTDAAVAEWPVEQRTILHLLFDPTSPLYALLGGGNRHWEQLVRRGLLTFKRHNHLSRYEVWYGQRIGDLRQLPHFARLWQAVEADADAPGEAEHLLMRSNCWAALGSR